MKILAIGNSFSQDATRYLHKISRGELYVRNLYIGGCSLKMHMDGIVQERDDYEFQKDAKAVRNSSIREALQYKEWDYITIQQVSGLSGEEESYEPYIGQLIAFIKEYCPDAKIILHQTWAYELDSPHHEFNRYQCNQELMFERIVEVTERFATKYQLPVIPVGDAIQKLRRTAKEFDYANGGLSLCRDGYHLSLDYGRYAAALVWYHFFKGKDLETVTYIPRGTKKNLIKLIQRTL